MPDPNLDAAAIHDLLGRSGFAVPRDELEGRVLGMATRFALRDVQSRFGIEPTGEVDAETTAALETVAAAARAPNETAHGRVYLTDGRAAADLTLRLYRVGFGGEREVVGEARTNAEGFYTLPFGADAADASVELRAVPERGDEIVLSAQTFKPGEVGALNVVAPADVKPLTAEFERLAAAVEERIGGIERLAEAVEGDERRDLTVLRQTTGWDARLVGLAAAATRLTAESGVPASALYGLFRAGLPTDPAELAFVAPEAVTAALKKADEAGVVGLGREELKQAREAFDGWARTARRAARAPGALSTYGELLQNSRLTADEAKAFEDLHFARRDGDGTLWERARRAGIPERKVEALRLQGKLGYLTRNNAPLAEALQAELGSPDEIGKLVDGGLHTPGAWKQRLRDLAGGDAQRLGGLIPPAYEGADVDARLDVYADDLARKVRVSFPTAVVKKLVDDGELPIEGDGTASRVSRFLEKAMDAGFELGREPVEKFVAEHDGLVSEAERAGTLDEVKTLQRLFQITPGNEAMKTLKKQGFTSAYEVWKLGRHFKDYYGGEFETWEEAELVERKAEQVAATVYGWYTAAQQLDSPPLFGISPPKEERDAAKDELVKQYPTLESLFGSTDFCECEHCQSVLSPAAYLVDLLQFVNPEQLLWTGFKADWQTRHGEAYPFGTPYEALIERRPDLPELLLTCENTNTALPYIDLVNEILEYYVDEDGSLDAGAVRDTGSATTAELLAEPQHLRPGAYDKLRAARYPLTLPFDLWTETVRVFFEHFETPLWSALETFRAADDLTPHRARVFAEQLRLTPVDVALFTDADPLAKWHELYGYGSSQDALDELPSAKTLSRRLGVKYKELVELVKTEWMNPELDALVVLRKLDLDVTDAILFKLGRLDADPREAFEQKLEAAAERLPGFDAKQWLDEAWESGDLKNILVLSAPTPELDFGAAKLVRADGADATDFDYLKLNLFVRLWRKLGWTIAEVDAALAAFVPKDLAPLNGARIGPALATVLVYLAHLKTLTGRVKAGKNARLKLLTLWSDVPATLYAQLFLTPSVLRADPVFDSPLGDYLSTPGVLMKDHRLAVQAALGLTADDVDRTLADLGESPETAELTLPLVSALYRYGVLAKALKLTIRELIALRELSGVDPFEPLANAPLASLADDRPYRATLAFVDVVEALRAGELDVEAVEALLRHSPGPASGAASELVRTVADAVRQIETEHSEPADPGELTDEILAQKLALLLPADVAERLFAMWVGTVTWEASVGSVAAGDALDPQAFAADDAITVAYDHVSEVQRLTYRGVLLGPRRAQLEAAHPGALFSTLIRSVESAARAFYDEQLADAFAPGDYNPLFSPIPAGLSQAEQQTRIRQKRAILARSVLPALRNRLTRQAVVNALAAAVDLDRALVEAIATEARLAQLPSGSGSTLLDAFRGAARRGASAAWFASDDVSGAPLAEVTTPDVDTAGAPPNMRSARVEALLETTVAGPHRLTVQLDTQNAVAELRFDHLADPVLVGAAAAAGAELAAVVDLKPGVPYGVTLELRSLGGGGARMRVQAAGLPKGSVSRLVLRPKAAVALAERAYELLEKAATLVTRLGFDERELRHLAAPGTTFDGLDLSRLPTRAEDEALAELRALFGKLVRLIRYKRLRDAVAAAPGELVEVMQRSRRTVPAAMPEADARRLVLDDVCARLGTITGRQPETVEATAAALGYAVSAPVAGGSRRVQASGFGDEVGLERLWEALTMVERLGAPPASVQAWTRIATVAPADAAAIARDLKDTVKARYEPEAWQRVAQPIFDVLRRRQRDALTAWVMHERGYERLEQLFEQFLIDPGMEPVVQTSRIQLAIASVQLFIQRCFLNLEPKVRPAALNSRHWDWMKRYRFWEANRRLFLFPEVYLEPEWRDDKSHLFQALEGALLQGDVSADSVEDAFLGYLRALEELARLDVVAAYVEEKPLDPASNVLHVFGRTTQRPHKYFHRRLVHGSWAPWEPIPAEIEGDHLAPVVWRDRLHLFWVTFMEAGGESAKSTGTVESVRTATVSTATTPRVQAQLSWIEQVSGAWSERRSSGFTLTATLSPGAVFRSDGVHVHVTKAFEAGEEAAVVVNLVGAMSGSFRVVSRHAPPATSSNAEPAPTIPYGWERYKATKRVGHRGLRVEWNDVIRTEDGGKPQITRAQDTILSETGTFYLLFPSQRLALPAASGETDWPHVAALVSPFFFQDDRRTFYVEPRLDEKTLREYEDWVYTTYETGGDRIDWLDAIAVTPYVPDLERVPIAVDPDLDPIGPVAKYKVEPRTDWVVNPSTVLTFGDKLIGREGALGLRTATRVERLAVTDGTIDVRVAGGAEVMEVGEVREVLVERDGIDAGRTTVAVVGGGGLSPAVAATLTGEVLAGRMHELVARRIR